MKSFLYYWWLHPSRYRGVNALAAVVLNLFILFVKLPLFILYGIYTFFRFIYEQYRFRKYGFYDEQDDEDSYGSEVADIYNSLIKIENMSGKEFEFFCADLLRVNGYKNVSVTAASGDQGVDVLAEKEGLKYAFQCKKWSYPIGNTAVQEVSTGKTFYKCDVAVVLTNSTFTKGAVELAEATGVLLWDTTKLQALMAQVHE